MNFTVDYHTPSSLTKCKIGEELIDLLVEIRNEGCRISIEGIHKAVMWSKTAQNGEKYYIGCACTIRKGEAKMTEYTSF